MRHIITTDLDANKSISTDSGSPKSHSLSKGPHLRSLGTAASDFLFG